jgi:ribonuclease D
VASGLVGSVGDLKDLVRWHLDGRPEARRPALVRGWRGEVCGQVLLDVLAGRRSLRVSDPAADVPVALDPV